jgi:hypothetical protein
MAVTINASTTSGLVQSADLSGNLSLQSNGTTVATASSSGLAISTYNPSTSLITSGTAVASTSGTSIDFTSIPSWVKRITVMFNNVSLSGTAAFLIQLGTSGGIETTSYKSQTYYGGGSAGGSTSGFTAGVPAGGGGGANTYHGSYVICFVSSNTYVGSGVLAVLDNNTGVSMAGGSKSTASVVTTVRITTTNGTDTFDAGSINILYE